MDFDRFHILYVLDEDLKIIKIVNENEVMNALSNSRKHDFGQLTNEGKEKLQRATIVLS